MLSKFKVKVQVLVIKCLKYVLYLLPKDKNLILFNAWFGEKYADNTKFVFEYLLATQKYNVYWYTKNRALYQQLKSENIPVVYGPSLKGVWTHIRAKMLVSTVQLSDYNPYLLSNCIFLDLGHGHVIKDAGFDEKSIYLFLMCRELMDYYMVVTSDYSKENAIIEFHCKDNQVIISDFARNDVFFDKSLRINVNEKINHLVNGRKTVVYMPTHRSDGLVTLPMSHILDLDSIQKICEKTNSIFLIKKHYYHRNEVENLEDYDSIFDLSNDGTVESQVLLYQADFLITDYSAVYIDFLLLNRPLIFYHWDIEKFEKQERNIKIPFSKIDIGPKPQSPQELVEVLTNVLNFSEQDLFRERRLEWSKVYFNNLQNTAEGRKKVSVIISRLMNEH